MPHVTRNLLIVALLSWGALAMPSLCRAGMLEHLCSCGVSSNCEHEESCSQDPCVIAKPATESAGISQSLVPLPTLAMFPAAECPYLSALDSRTFASRPRPAVPPALRSGARPLLI